MNYVNHDKINLQHFCFLTDQIFLFSIIFISFTYIKISKDLLVKYYQDNKKRPLKKACERGITKSCNHPRPPTTTHNQP